MVGSGTSPTLFALCKIFVSEKERKGQSPEHTSGWKATHKTGALCSAGINQPLLSTAPRVRLSWGPQGARQPTALLTRSTRELFRARPRRGSGPRGKGELNPGSLQGKTPALARPSRQGSQRVVLAMVSAKVPLRSRPGHCPHSPGRKKEKMGTSRPFRIEDPNQQPTW